MLYAMPKKIQLAPSQAKWAIASTQSVLLLVGLDHLRQHYATHEFTEQLGSLIKKAKALDIPIVDIYGDDMSQGMQRLGELLSHYPQLIVAGQITPTLKQLLPHLYSVSEQVCLVDDAILLGNQQQHIQWLDGVTQQGFHHLNSYSLKRLWSLTAPREQILSPKGILLAIAEQLDVEPLEIDPSEDLSRYGLDSVAMVSLIGLWRANGAEIRYEDFIAQRSVQGLMQILLKSA